MSDFDRVGVTLVAQHIKAIEGFHNVTVDRLILKVTRDVLDGLRLQVELRCHRFQRIALFVNHVGEVFSFGCKGLHARLLCVQGFDFTANASQGLDLSGLNVIDADDVITEVRLHRSDQVTLLTRKDSRFEFRHHHALAEETEVTTILGAARILREFFGAFGKECRLGLKFGKELVSLFLIGHQDVAGTTLFGRRKALEVLFVEALDFVFTGLDVHEVSGRQRHVFDVDAFGHNE